MEQRESKVEVRWRRMSPESARMKSSFVVFNGAVWRNWKLQSTVTFVNAEAASSPLLTFKALKTDVSVCVCCGLGSEAIEPLKSCLPHA